VKVHFIAIGGSAMHNLALALHHKGYRVSGSDDEVFEPSKSRLAKFGLLPENMGWNPDRITEDLDAVILGMHARIDNPELEKAKKLGLKIYSYPEYIYKQTKDKTRVVIGGSHGKTTITAMILHVLNQVGIDADYMVGAQLEGFDTMVKLTKEAKVAILEGDEYLSSPIDRRPKFHLYKPNIALLSGIAWDHVNVFPTFENYVEQFSMFVDLIRKDGKLIYCIDDMEVKKVAEDSDVDIELLPYSLPPHVIESGVTYLLTDHGKVPLKVFGNHNLINLNGARLVCGSLGVSDNDFYKAIQSFKGASKRLELLAASKYTAVYKDFAHSPSKVKATVKAVKHQFRLRKLVACLELHTFSSLSLKFLEEYKKSMKSADVAIVYFNPKTLKHKKLPELTKKQVKKAFDRKDLEVFTDSAKLEKHLAKMEWKRKNLLMMSSGSFDGVDLNSLADKVSS
jgi:UDP-N-acetylmuramate: L-alanyl-gamma-D-glutamyl-meso-diaminopimelate ligase